MDASAFEQVYGAFQDFHAYFGPLFGRREARVDLAEELAQVPISGLPSEKFAIRYV